MFYLYSNKIFGLIKQKHTKNLKLDYCLKIKKKKTKTIVSNHLNAKIV